ncbi:MAG: 3-hydroxybutyryl-CoA dehydrogenase [Alphaproteobacteria bacterium]|jgi:3-hydroxybutyryl-CoA dehydrogenase|nr:3-hydroxybutyryl-CoA dehydrogenase [Alphaproteobacteria bacterium]
MLENIAVIGAGQMGSGIAQVFALANKEVQLIDISEDQLAHARAYIEKNLDKQVTKGSITTLEKDSALKQLRFSNVIQNPESLDLAVEAIVENFDLKAHIFKSLDSSLNDAAIIASNTSSLSITELGKITSRPDRVIGMHFMNPAPIMPLIEIIQGQNTSQQTYNTIVTMVHELKKTPVTSKDSPGFIVNRILMPMINEAIFALNDEVASAQDIDTAMKLGTNQPMGPLELADFIGLDTCLWIMQVLHEGFADDKYRPCPLLQEYVTQGRLGRKSGHGFYEYPKK